MKFGGINMIISIGSDHAGFNTKKIIKENLEKKGYKVIDFGTFNEDSVNYPLFAFKVGESVVKKESEYGIVICGTGIGVSISANKVKGVRCALVTDENTAKLSREHNDANVLALSGRFTPIETNLKIVDLFLKTPFANGRHCTRIDLISEYERNH